MQNIEAARALSALGHETRLSIFRALVQAGPEGMAAGDIARRLDLAPNALSFHLKDLTYVGLIDSRPSGRFVIYSAVFPVINALMAYLTENCCGGADCGGAASSRDHLRSVVNQPARTTPARRKAAAGKSGSVRARSKR